MIYGFSGRRRSVATRGPLLERYFQSTGAGEIASGRPSTALLGSVRARLVMTVTPGMTDADPRAGFRLDACHFSDDRVADRPRKLAFVHDAVGRDRAEVRMFLDRRALVRRRWRTPTGRRRTSPRSTRSRAMATRASATSRSRATPTSPPCACA